MRRSGSLVAVLACVCALAALGGASASLGNTAAPSPALGQLQGFLPPAGKVLQGVATLPLSAYTDPAHKHPAVYQEFVAWGQWIPAITRDATDNRARMMMMITTRYGARNKITPRGIADGHGDAWLIALGAQIAASGNVTYVRLMSEMDNYVNAYCAFNADGSSRGRAFSTTEFKQAWRRVALILAGGQVAAIDRQLAALRMPALRTRLAALAHGRVSMAWVPMVAGNPDTRANSPAAYFPGRRWVQWVGTDFYSRYPNFRGLTAFYDHYRGYPFVFGEYAMWGGGGAGWIDQLFNWIARRPSVRMLVYNDASPDFWLSHYPAAARALRHRLAAGRFLSYAPGWTPAR